LLESSSTLLIVLEEGWSIVEARRVDDASEIARRFPAEVVVLVSAGALGAMNLGNGFFVFTSDRRRVAAMVGRLTGVA